MNKQRQAFTLVELIVVITIIAILGTIAFIPLQGYSKSSRDSVRISDVSNMKTSLELYQLNSGKYPLPDNGAEVSFSGDTLWTQGIFGETVITNLSRNFSEVPKDPLSDREYIYSVSNTKNEFEILTLLEGDLALNFIQQTNAATINVTPKINGTYNGVFIKSLNYILPTPSIINSEVDGVNLDLDNINIKSQIVSGGENIPNYGNVNYATGKLLGLELSISNAINSNSSKEDKLLVINTIQTAYSGVTSITDEKINDILSKTTDEDKLSLVEYLVLNKPAPVRSITNTTPQPETPPTLLLHADGDASSSNHTYTTHGNPQIVSDGGQFDGAMIFDGVDDYLSIPDSPDFDFGSGDFTIDFWVKPIAGGYLYESREIANKFSIFLDSATLGRVLIDNVDVINNIVFTENIWQHFALIRNNDSLIAYINGVQSGNIYNATGVTIGSSLANTIGGNSIAGNFSGLIDEFRTSKGIARHNFDRGFNAVTYAGSGTPQSVTGVGLQPDLTWIKSRNNIRNHWIHDSTRGVLKQLSSNTIDTETNWDHIRSFDIDGFTLGALSGVNTNLENYVSWNWKKGVDYGLDIVEYVGDGVNGKTVAHNLNKSPDLIIIKDLAEGGWVVYHGANSASPENERLLLHSDVASSGFGNLYWNKIKPSLTDFTLGIDGDVNEDGNNFIAYLFTEKTGFSKFGSYTGNGSTTGPEVDLGFKPAFVMIKRTDSTGNWQISDSVRASGTIFSEKLYADLSNIEDTTAANNIEYTSTGFKILGTGAGQNASGGDYVYIAFANGVAETFIPATSSYATDINTKLLLHFDGDSSTSKHDISFNGGTKVDTNEGKFNGSYSFDGIDDYISIPDSEDWNFGTGSFTIDFWMNPTTYNNTFGGGIIEIANSYYDQRLQLKLSITGLLDFEINNHGVDLLSSTVALLNTWTHVAVVRENSMFSLYINGNLEATDDSIGTNWNSSIDIGKTYEAGILYYLNGYIDELRISKGVARWIEDFVPDTSPY